MYVIVIVTHTCSIVRNGKSVGIIGGVFGNVYRAQKGKLHPGRTEVREIVEWSVYTQRFKTMLSTFRA